MNCNANKEINITSSSIFTFKSYPNIKRFHPEAIVKTLWIISPSLLRYQHSITLQVPSFISIDERFEEHQESVETELGYQRTSGKLSDEWESVLRATK